MTQMYSSLAKGAYDLQCEVCNRAGTLDDPVFDHDFAGVSLFAHSNCWRDLVEYQEPEKTENLWDEKQKEFDKHLEDKIAMSSSSNDTRLAEFLAEIDFDIRTSSRDHEEEGDGAYGCPNCERQTDEWGDGNCPNCGEPLVDAEWDDDPYHSYDDDDGPGDYERYGPDRTTWADIQRQERNASFLA